MDASDRVDISNQPTARPMGCGPNLRLLAAGVCLLPTLGFAVACVMLWPDFTASGYAEPFFVAGVATLIGLLAQAGFLNRMLGRLTTLSLIGDALADRARRQDDLDALRITSERSALASHWNSLVDELSRARQDRLLGDVQGKLGQNSAAPSARDHTLDALPHGVVLVDARRQVATANGAACRMLARSRDRLIGAPLDKLADDQNLLGVIDRVLRGNDPRGGTVEMTLAAEDGQSAIMRVTVRPVGRGEDLKAMAVFEDVTQQRTADQSRNLFVAQATHELRTPLTNISLYLERAIDLTDEEVAERAECLNVINSEVLRLGRVVEEVLSVSQIEAGSLQIGRDDVRLEFLMQQLEQEYQPQATDKQLKLSVQMPPKMPVLQGDRDKIGLALHNLVGNALKYTPAGGIVRIDVNHDEHELTVSVSDTGIGIAEADLPRVFDKFYRADDKRLAEIKGTGLGLALAREVIRLHGGDITVDSTLDQGSTFTLRLPLHAHAAAAA